MNFVNLQVQLWKHIVQVQPYNYIKVEAILTNQGQPGNLLVPPPPPQSNVFARLLVLEEVLMGHCRYQSLVKLILQPLCEKRSGTSTSMVAGVVGGCVWTWSCPHFQEGWVVIAWEVWEWGETCIVYCCCPKYPPPPTPTSPSPQTTPSNF